MAEAAISFALEKLTDLAIQKVGFLRGVEGQVQWLKGELERIRCFLKDAAEKQSNDERIRKWISDIRDVAQDAEDIIETFILKVETPTRSRGLLENCACFPNHVYHLDKLGQEIQAIRTRLQDIDDSRQRYGIQNLGEGMDFSRRSDVVQLRRLSPWQRDKHLVGLEEDVELLLRRAILEERRGLSIATIVGMGGIGKSTLARLLYNHADIVERFERRAWVCVSSEFNPKEIIKELVLQLLEPNEGMLTVLEIMEKSPMEHIKRMLHERLKGKRYLIVLDDVWREQAWESLASAFPDEPDKTCRLLLTSRRRDIASTARYVHEMKTLDTDNSWKLLLNKAFIDNTNSACPPELENIGREILKKCDGLPLAITVVGGLLVKQSQSRSGWEKVLKGLDSHLGRSRSSNVSAVLELSYHDLPPQLKSCFLCLSFFREDATIRAEKLVQLWIAEGLISQQGHHEQETMEDIATSYLDELVNRNMVQVKDMNKDGRVKNCHMHDLLHELSITKAKEELSFEILREGIDSQSSDKKSRHRAIYCTTEKRFIFSSGSLNKHLRSLFFHRSGNISGNSSYNWKSFGLLRVLDFENFGLKKLPDAIGELTELRYLGLRNNKYLEVLPRSLGRLKNLQVLDIAGNASLKVPDIIWKMDNLRHLYVCHIFYSKVCLKIDTLKNLQTLVHISESNWMFKHLTEMTSLRTLGIYQDKNEDVRELCTSLAKLENLVCLKLSWNFGHLPLDGLVILHRLTQLKLKGTLTTLPNVENFPPNLSYLSLVETSLPGDPMPVLEKLPKLLYLKLGREAYEGEEMAISPDGFPKLKVLSLCDLYELRKVRVGRGGARELERLEIYECRDLDRLPEELRYMTNLQELKVVTSVEVASKLRSVDSEIISSIHL